MFDTSFSRIMFATDDNTVDAKREYFHELRQEFANIEIVRGMPNLQNLNNNHELPMLLVLDDLASNVLNDKFAFDVFIKGSHHHNITVLFTVQNMYMKSINGTSIYRNLSHSVIFEQSCDKTPLATFGRRAFHNYPTILIDAFEWIRSNIGDRHPYLLIDTNPLNNALPVALRVSYDIFPKANGLKEAIYFSEPVVSS